MREFIIIGAGQAGLAAAYYLKQHMLDYMIIDANHQVGAPWLNRWDSLKLFTPTEFNHLPGMPFPFKQGHYPNKYQVADYLQSYARNFAMPIKFGHKILKLKKTGDIFVLKSQTKTFLAKNVIVATGPFHTPYKPKFHQKISPEIVQIHSEHYKNTDQLQKGDTLVVGSGDSGVQILQEIADTGRQVYFSGETRIASMPQELFGKTLWWWFARLGFLSVNKYSWLGKHLSRRAQPVIGTDVKALLKRKNVTSVGRALDAQNANIIFKKANVSSIKNIIWATGFKPSFHWIKNIQLDELSYPKNYRGVSPMQGLYFVGLPWLYTRGSATLGGVKKDAEYLIDMIMNNNFSDEVSDCA